MGDASTPLGSCRAAPQDVGDRRGGFDFNYRVPGLRDWLTLYGDFFTDDDPSPLAAPRRSAIMPGIYLAKFPFLHKLDFRAEAPDDGAVGDQRIPAASFFTSMAPFATATPTRESSWAIGLEGRPRDFFLPAGT